jgi:pseudo-rSAM protein
LISFPIHEKSVQKILKLYGNGENTVFHFLIENEDQFDKVESYIEVFDLKQTKIVPVFTGNNWNFFKENIFLQREDVLTVTTHQKIFCNQKLNSNFFGKLYFLPDGSVKASMNSVEVGNIYKDKLLQVVLNEMNHNTAWRNIRSEEPCCNCLYQYLCPAPSNYENVMKKTNLCHVKP